MTRNSYDGLISLKQFECIFKAKYSFYNPWYAKWIGHVHIECKFTSIRIWHLISILTLAVAKYPLKYIKENLKTIGLFTTVGQLFTSFKLKRFTNTPAAISHGFRRYSQYASATPRATWHMSTAAAPSLLTP